MAQPSLGVGKIMFGMWLWEKSKWLGVGRIYGPHCLHPDQLSPQAKQGYTQLGGSKRDGSYQVKESYLHPSSRKTVNDLWPWKLIWRTKTPRKSYFSWVSLNSSCLTHDNFMRRKFRLAKRCYMCSCNPNLSITCFFIALLPQAFGTYSFLSLAWLGPCLSLWERLLCVEFLGSP